MFKLIFLMTLLVGSCFQLVFAASDYYYQFSLEDPSEARQTNYGVSMSTNNEFIIIGATSTDIDEVKRVGKVYLYDYEGNLQKTLEPNKALQDESFGSSIITHNDDLYILQLTSGYWIESGALSAIYFYDASGQYQKVMNISDSELEASFGYSIIYHDGKFIASAPGTDTKYGYSTGIVHVFDQTGEILDKVYSPDPKPQCNFGARLAADEDVIVVVELHGLFSDERFVKGIMYIYDLDWNLQSSLTAPNSGDIDNFGYSLAIDGDFIIVGDKLAKVGEYDRAGEVYVFDKGGELVRTISNPEPSSGANFGISFSVDDGLLVIGEPRADSDSSDTGKAHVYNVDGTYVSELVSPDPVAMGLFGGTVYVSNDMIFVCEVKTNTVHVFSPEANGNGPIIPGFPMVSILLSLVLLALLVRIRAHHFLA